MGPKRTKFRRIHRGILKGVSKANKIVFGEFGIQALEPVWLTSRQIEATRRSITRYVRRSGKIWIRVFPDKPITERAAESRMGSGKGTPEYWVAVNSRISHKNYKKVTTRTKRYVVHDSEFNTKIGDKVKIQETRPISKTKRWVLINVL